MTTSRRTALKALLSAPAVGAFATTTAQAQATPAVPPAPGQSPVWPAPNTAPPSTQDAPHQPPSWSGSVPARFPHSG